MVIPSQCSGLPPLAPGAAGSGRQQQFAALQQHIDELTEEKLALLRGMSQQSRMVQGLQEENEALTEQYNARGALVDQLRKQASAAAAGCGAGLVLERGNRVRCRAQRPVQAGGRHGPIGAEELILVLLLCCKQVPP